MRRFVGLLLVAGLLCSVPEPAPGYSVFTHQQLIDLTWKNLLLPLLKKRFPQTTTAGLEEAHAYAFGGCAIQDLGYYPSGNKFFSDLTHYVRSGDFIMNLLRGARNANEYAFALGALSHYVGDNVGHHDAINRATPLAFPKLRKKYGVVVTYDENPHAHVRTEFAFDIDELSHHRLAPGAYLRFVGFQVSRRLLAEAFEETYSLRLGEVVGRGRPAIQSYRTAVRSFLPRIAHAETVLHRNDFPPDVPDAAFQKYLDYIAQADFQTVWNSYRRKPGVTTHLIALLILITPRIGTLSDVAIKIPTQDTQDLYLKSVNRTIDVYGGLLKQLTVSSQPPQIANLDLDTGERSKPGGYALTDQTYAKLLHKITADPADPVEPDLRRDILEYYNSPNAPITTKRKRKAWAQVLKDLAILRNMPGPATPNNQRSTSELVVPANRNSNGIN